MIPSASFRVRSVLFVLATCGVAVAVACTVFLVHDRINVRDGLVDRLRTQSMVVATSTTAALALGDQETARQLLGALEADPIIEAACLYDARGEVVASYLRPGGPGLCPARPPARPHEEVGDALLVRSAIGRQPDGIGSVVLISDLSPVDARTMRFLAIIAIVMVASFIAAFAMAARLQGAAVQRAEHVAESLRLSEEQLRFVGDHVPVGIFRTDAAGEVTYANQRLLDVLDVDSAPLLARRWDQVVHPDDRDGVMADWQAALASGAELARELKIQIRGEVRWVAVQTRPLHDRNGQRQIVGTIADVTHRKQAEQERDRMSLERLEMSRQAGMAEVATGVLHNVGNVLNSVNVAAAVLRDRLRNSSVGQLAKVAALLEQNRDRLTDYLTRDPRGVHLVPFVTALASRLDDERTGLLGEMRTIDENIEHIKQIITTQQTFARRGGSIELLDLAALIDGALAVSLPETAARHGIQVDRDYQPIPPVQVDKHKVLQVLINLLGNAKHAVMDSPHQDRRIIVRSRLRDGRIRIEVEDNGVGISPENLDRIFRFGFTTRDKGHGFGLHGSALAAKQLQGSLLVHSDGVGRGALFALELPGY